MANSTQLFARSKNAGRPNHHHGLRGGSDCEGEDRKRDAHQRSNCQKTNNSSRDNSHRIQQDLSIGARQSAHGLSQADKLRPRQRQHLDAEREASLCSKQDGTRLIALDDSYEAYAERDANVQGADERPLLRPAVEVSRDSSIASHFAAGLVGNCDGLVARGTDGSILPLSQKDDTAAAGSSW